MAKKPTKDKIKISAFLNTKTLPKVKKAAKDLKVSMTDYVSDAVEQRLNAVERKRLQRAGAK